MPERVGTPGLTNAYDRELSRQIARTVPGMAHFAATGPFGCRCSDCAHYGYPRVLRNASGNIVKTTIRRQACGQFFKLTATHGPTIPPNTEACRHFTPKK
ncbi:hypothetical protein JQ595_16500 [Bradyrhizobium japonicum]|uniref:hypothetical protein n=1 Tax=Bradyrhizobium japonicum TaxID=375 RepID=UPI001BA54120|nr:hypothetical protein [Bradyrhizobium japonicum]MBR0730353.1 hypothetical protein [Bradyrhizobium japonicum]